MVNGRGNSLCFSFSLSLSLLTSTSPHHSKLKPTTQKLQWWSVRGGLRLRLLYNLVYVVLSTSRPHDALQWDSKFVLTSDEHKWFSDSPLTHPSLWSGWSLLSRSCRICRHRCRCHTGLLLQRNRWCCHSRFSAGGRARKQKDSKSYKNVKKKLIGMNEFVNVDCKMSLQTCMLLICLHNAKR